MSAYTPGPWAIYEDVPDRLIGMRAIIAVNSSGDYGITICNPSPMGEANARLIAAAPELADALRATLRCLQWHAERHGVGMDAKAVADAHALLDRIEGAR
jgi:hypothetical protein